MNQAEFDVKYGRRAPGAGDPSFLHVLGRKLRPAWFKKRFLRTFPFLVWMPRYNITEQLMGDVIGGLTVGIMHVPQGMAYATLVGVEPIYGLYTSFFAALIYMFLGTSRHISIGTFAVGSMMVGAVRFRLLPDTQEPENHDPLLANLTQAVSMADSVKHVALDAPTLISTLTLGVGLIQLLMGILRLSCLTDYMSDQLIAGYTTATATHVFVSQVNKLLGTKLPRYSGNGMLFLMIRDIIKSVPNVNFLTLGVSLFGLAFLYIGKYYINPVVKKRCPVPIPFELLLIIGGTALSGFYDFHDKFHVKTVNHIPQGLPPLKLPRVDLLPSLLLDCLPIAIICYMFVVSLGKLFARKHGYKIDATQELYAIGISQVLSSFVPVYPTGAALSRSTVCEASGISTQLYNIFSGALLFSVILWLGPLLEPLPMCILACVVMVSLKPLLLQVTQLPRLWRVSKHDFAVFVISWLATLCTTVTMGLFVAVVFVVLSVVMRQQSPRFRTYNSDERNETFRAVRCYDALSKLPVGVHLLKFEAPLHFANVNKFIDTLTVLITGEDDYEVEEIDVVPNSDGVEEIVKKAGAARRRTVIVDFSAVVFVDTMGLDAIKEMDKLATKHKTTLVLASVPDAVLDVFECANVFDFLPKERIYPSVVSAVQNSQV